MAAPNHVAGSSRQDVRTINQSTVETVVSFHIENIPAFIDHYKLRYLVTRVWKLPEYKKLTDIYLPSKRSIAGKRYGFLRFTGLKDEKEMTATLNTKSIRASPLSCSLSRGKRHKPSTTEKILKPAQVAPQRRIINGDVRPIAKDSNRSWANIVSGDSHGWKAVQNREPAKPTYTYGQVIPIETPSENIEWINRSAVGILRNLRQLTEVSDIIRKAGWLCKPKIMGRGMFWLEFPSREARDSSLGEENEVVGEAFSSVVPWSESLGGGGRIVWVQCCGIPANTWGPSTFERIVKPLGTLLDIDVCTASKRRLDIARLLVATEHSHIKGSIPISVEGKSYGVWCQEEVWQELLPAEEWIIEDSGAHLMKSPVSSPADREDLEPGSVGVTDIDRIFAEGLRNKKTALDTPGEDFFDGFPAVEVDSPPCPNPLLGGNAGSSSELIVPESQMQTPIQPVNLNVQFRENANLTEERGSLEPGEIPETVRTTMWGVGSKMDFTSGTAKEVIDEYEKSHSVLGMAGQ